MIEPDGREVFIDHLLRHKLVSSRIAGSERVYVWHWPQRKILLRRGIDRYISGNEISGARSDRGHIYRIGDSRGLPIAFIVREEKRVILPERAAQCPPN